MTICDSDVIDILDLPWTTKKKVIINVVVVYLISETAWLFSSDKLGLKKKTEWNKTLSGFPWSVIIDIKLLRDPFLCRTTKM